MNLHVTRAKTRWWHWWKTISRNSHVRREVSHYGYSSIARFVFLTLDVTIEW